MLRTDMPTDKKPSRGRRGKRRTMLESPDLRWQAGREEKWVTVIERVANKRILKTDVGLVHVKDNSRFQKNMSFPCWVEPDTGRMVARGLPRSPYRW